MIIKNIILKKCLPFSYKFLKKILKKCIHSSTDEIQRETYKGNKKISTKEFFFFLKKCKSKKCQSNFFSKMIKN